MSDGSNYLDPDRPDAVRLSVSDARALGEAALGRIGYGEDDGRIITDQLIDNSLCGYRFAGLPRILAIAREARTRNARVPIDVVRETPVSALVDGGNNVGYVAVYRGAEIAIAKAKQSGVAAVGVYKQLFQRAQRLLPRTYRRCRTCRSSHRQRLAAHRTARRNPPGSGYQPDRLRLSVGRRARHFRHRHGIADVGRGIACRRNRRSVAAGPGVRRRWEPHPRRTRRGEGRGLRLWRT